MIIQDLFVSILSRLPQKIELDLENHFGTSQSQDTLSRLRQNRPVAVIEIFYFIYHSLDRQFYGLIEKGVKDQLFDQVLYEAILDMKTVHSGNVEIAEEILNNMDPRQNKYVTFESAIDTQTPFGPSVVNHIAGIICSLLGSQQYRMELVLIFFRAYKAIGTALLMICSEESHRDNEWDLKSNTTDAEDTIIRALLNTDFLKQ